MQYILNLFNKTQPSDLESLENTVNYTDTSTVDLLDSERSHISFLDDITDNTIKVTKEDFDDYMTMLNWDIQQANDSGDTQRVHELITIKNDMN